MVPSVPDFRYFQRCILEIFIDPLPINSPANIHWKGILILIIIEIEDDQFHAQDPEDITLLSHLCLL